MVSRFESIAEGACLHSATAASCSRIAVGSCPSCSGPYIDPLSRCRFTGTWPLIIVESQTSIVVLNTPVSIWLGNLPSLNIIDHKLSVVSCVVSLGPKPQLSPPSPVQHRSHDPLPQNPKSNHKKQLPKAMKPQTRSGAGSEVETLWQRPTTEPKGSGEFDWGFSDLVVSRFARFTWLPVEFESFFLQLLLHASFSTVRHFRYPGKRRVH